MDVDEEGNNYAPNASMITSYQLSLPIPHTVPFAVISTALTCSGFSEGVPGAAKKNAEASDNLLEDEYGAKDYRKVLQLKLDHSNRPLWVVSV